MDSITDKLDNEGRVILSPTETVTAGGIIDTSAGPLQTQSGLRSEHLAFGVVDSGRFVNNGYTDHYDVMVNGQCEIVQGVYEWCQGSAVINEREILCVGQRKGIYRWDYIDLTFRLIPYPEEVLNANDRIKFKGCSLMKDGRLALGPSTINNTWFFDPSDETFTKGPIINTGTSIIDDIQGVLRVDNNIIFVGFSDGSITVMDMDSYVTNVITYRPRLESDGESAIGVYGCTPTPDGRIVLFPQTNNSTLYIVDPSSGSVVSLDISFTGISGVRRTSAGTVTEDGKVVIPFMIATSNYIIIVDPMDGGHKIVELNADATSIETIYLYPVKLLPNGKIFIPSVTGSKSCIIDVEGRSKQLLDTPGIHTAHVLPDGSIFCTGTDPGGAVIIRYDGMVPIGLDVAMNPLFSNY